MAVGQFPFPQMAVVPGVELATASAGIKKPGRQDVVVFRLAEGSRVAGVFTKNAFCAAPVTLAKQHLAQGNIRFLIINSGNANACTGEPGLADALQTCSELAAQAGVTAQQVLPYSTGVIGERLPMAKLLGAVPAALAGLQPDNWEAAGRAIMTTDTRPKGASVQIEHDGETIVINGISKGAGMIKPNMATMLGYVATNARVDQALLNELSREAADQSFNRITVDGDTSTNDACMLMATGQTSLPEINTRDGELYRKFHDALMQVYRYLAHAIVADGEGATKFVTVQVEGAECQAEALRVAYAVAQSPLIKTALFACDPNWGRIVAAIGYAGVKGLDATAVKVWLNDVLIVEGGGRAASYTEEQGQAVMDGEEILIRIDLGRGDIRETVWTTDLSHEYVTINAEYRT
ncbi:bifunctional glutamate N-acetyltransferase/amino-acid acetyltransferase ArgJ [Pseudomaricurvus sp. HS19]|uniref:bifunctional glutamate N-acetyltransferase/amino-acid acetyltransferase ArgJ n=1 Tax=Pseudomaricurvus sp. HS19 TaxID=2692626 RepID=UPI00136E6AE8|nr:bifunctional glutamate N-acetyltransferase/amino-acid acetyltransferase ArgJ [Pseudomaricurvus sp. HS19]MYM64697.1 bifunctional glutamate N-acetyltransferase/amino-acid acetyltransferase ArgJ [Pseudomaricurvus sp. HS19]